MSKTPVLTDKQKRSTLSAKKKPPKASVKNVLAQPFKRYWPQITEDEAKSLIDELSRVRVPDGDGLDSTIWKSKFITIGISSTLRLLPKGDVDLLIISASIKPKYVVDQIVMLAIARNPNVKIVCIQRLSELLADTIGFASCLCFALVGASNQPQLHGIQTTISELSKRFPIPNTYKRPATVVDAMDVDPAPKTKPKTFLPPVAFDDLYMEKKSIGRSFIPAGTVVRPKVSNDWSDFISLGEPVKASGNGALKHKVKKHSGPTKAKSIPTNYITLTVNKVQGNPNKVKKNKHNK